MMKLGFCWSFSEPMKACSHFKYDTVDSISFFDSFEIVWLTASQIAALQLFLLPTSVVKIFLMSLLNLSCVRSSYLTETDLRLLDEVFPLFLSLAAQSLTSLHYLAFFRFDYQIPHLL